MKVSFLGTGTSQGIPVLGCSCEVCTSTDPRDKRLRSSIFVQTDRAKILIDCGPDFRQQALRGDIHDLDALFLTHEHNDHIIGMDDLRPILFRKKGKTLPIYALPRVKGELKKRFPYAFEQQLYPGAPSFEVHEMEAGDTRHVEDLVVEAIPVLHGQLPILGYRIGNFAYLTDVRYLEENALKRLRNLDVLVLSALQRRKHHSHINWDQAQDLAQRIGAKKTYFTHVSHYLGRHADLLKELTPERTMAYDGLVIDSD